MFRIRGPSGTVSCSPESYCTFTCPSHVKAVILAGHQLSPVSVLIPPVSTRTVSPISRAFELLLARALRWLGNRVGILLSTVAPSSASLVMQAALCSARS